MWAHVQMPSLSLAASASSAATPVASLCSSWFLNVLPPPSLHASECAGLASAGFRFLSPQLKNEILEGRR